MPNHEQPARSAGHGYPVRHHVRPAAGIYADLHARGLAVATNNVARLGRIEMLTIENWLR